MKSESQCFVSDESDMILLWPGLTCTGAYDGAEEVRGGSGGDKPRPGISGETGADTRGACARRAGVS